jgi:hypothetical protein
MQRSLHSLLQLIKCPVFLEHVFLTRTEDRAVYLCSTLMIIFPVQTPLFPKNLSVFLGAFAKLRKAIIGFVMTSCLSVRPYRITRLPMETFI